MSSYNRRGCFKCGGPFGGLYCRQCTCEQCRINYTDEVCALCYYEVEKSFVNDLNPNSFIDSLNIFKPPPQPQTYSCEFCGNNAHYGYNFPPQVPLIYNPKPCYNQEFDNDFPQICVMCLFDPLDALKDHSEIFFDPNDDYASSDDDPNYSEDIDYVDASPPDSELVS
ncbi:hypothetical protein Tco_1230792 [Tanacetum coccineum]